MSFKVENNRLIFGSAAISFQRTLRIPEDGKSYPLPPSFGYFPVHKIDDFIDKVPEEWKKHGGVFMPMYQREVCHAIINLCIFRLYGVTFDIDSLFFLFNLFLFYNYYY